MKLYRSTHCDVPIDSPKFRCGLALLIYCDAVYMFSFAFWSILDLFCCCGINLFLLKNFL